MNKKMKIKEVKEEVVDENKIMILIRMLIGTKKRKTFWDWLTDKA